MERWKENLSRGGKSIKRENKKYRNKENGRKY